MRRMRFPSLVFTPPPRALALPTAPLASRLSPQMVDEFPTGREARRRFGWRPYVASMAVSASERRRGIGRELLRAAERTARGWGYRELMLEVAQENDVAVRLPTLLGRPARAASLP